MALTTNQLYVLKLLDLAGKIDGKTKFQKMMFLAETEETAITTYNFEKYHYGPFSFDLSDDLDALSKTNFIQEEKTVFGSSEGKQMIKSTFSLTFDGKKELSENEVILNMEGVIALSKTVEKWNKKNLDEIIKYVYSKYMNDDNRTLAIAK